MSAASARSRPWNEIWWYLLWLMFLLIPLLTDRSIVNWLATATAILLFLAVFLYGFHRTGVKLWLARLAMFGLGVGLFPYNSFAHTFFLYAGMPGIGLGIAESLLLGGAALTGSFAYFAVQGQSAVYYAICSIIILVMQIGALLQRLQSSRQALAGKDQEIAHLAKVAERDRIARDLHDVLGHTLSMIALKSELAQRLAPRDASRAADEMRDVAAAAREALSTVRQTIAGLRRMNFAEGLSATLSMLKIADVETEQHLVPLPALSDAQEQALAQALLEAGTNIVRHAAAQRAVIWLEHDAQTLTLRIEDDGRGGDVLPGNGLAGMRERLASVGANMKFINMERGMRLEIALPLRMTP